MTAQQTTVVYSPREILGRKVSQLRNLGQLPANIFGLGQPSLAISLDTKQFNKLVATNPDLNLVYLAKENSTDSPTPALVEDVVAQSVTGELQHVTFRRVSLKEKVETEVPIEMIGEIDVPETTVVQVMDEVTIEALPTDIPDKIEVNIEGLLQAGDVITLDQLVFDKTKITLVATEEELSQPVVILQAVVEEVEEVVEEVAAEGTETPEGESAEGEKPAESGDKPEGEKDEGDKKE